MFLKSRGRIIALSVHVLIVFLEGTNRGVNLVLPFELFLPEPARLSRLHGRYLHHVPGVRGLSSLQKLPLARNTQVDGVSLRL